MRSFTKAQSAIEYLMTYGWMLLVVAVVGGAVFSVVGDQSVESVNGFNGEDIQIEDYGLNANGGLKLSLRSGSSEQIEVKKVEVHDSEKGVTATLNTSNTVPVGETSLVELKGIEPTENSKTYDMTITYNAGGLEDLTAEGRITGSFGVFNRLSLENAKFNRSTNELQIDVKNKGGNTTNSISYNVKANNTDYTGSLSNLDAGETTQINVSTDETYSLQSVNLDTEGYEFVNTSSGLKCTPTKGLVGYWPFNQEQTKNGYAIDLSGYGNNGSLNGVKTDANGKTGEAYSFDDSNGEYVSVPDSTILDVSDNLTLSASVVLNSGTGPYNLISRENDGYRWRVDGDHSHWFLLSNESKQTVKKRSKTISTGKWTDYSVRYDLQDEKVSWFVDGQKDDEVTANVENLTESNLPFYIGTYDANGEFWNGKIDEVRIYNRSLSQSEIQRLYNVRSEDWAVSGCRLTN